VRDSLWSATGAPGRVAATTVRHRAAGLPGWPRRPRTVSGGHSLALGAWNAGRSVAVAGAGPSRTGRRERRGPSQFDPSAGRRDSRLPVPQRAGESGSRTAPHAEPRSPVRGLRLGKPIEDLGDRRLLRDRGDETNCSGAPRAVESTYVEHTAKKRSPVHVLAHGRGAPTIGSLHFGLCGWIRARELERPAATASTTATGCPHRCSRGTSSPSSCVAADLIALGHPEHLGSNRSRTPHRWHPPSAPVCRKLTPVATWASARARSPVPLHLPHHPPSAS